MNNIISVAILHSIAPLAIIRKQLKILLCDTFNYFSTMGSTTILQHIISYLFHRMYSYYQCKHHLVNEDSPHHYLAKDFVDNFKSLPCTYW